MSRASSIPDGRHDWRDLSETGMRRFQSSGPPEPQCMSFSGGLGTSQNSRSRTHRGSDRNGEQDIIG